MADVFVSYSRKNRDRVEAISGGLQQSGYSLWWDERLAASDDYAMLIEAEIDAARCVVVAWSASARQSLWVRAEANEALDSGKLVQLSLDQAKLPLPFTMLHFLDFSRWGGERQGSLWGDFEGKVGAFVRGEGPADAALAYNVPRGPALQGLGRTAWLGWLAIVLAASIAGAAGMAATGRIAPAAFDGLALTALVLALLLLALTAFLLLKISAASRR
ncbi:MAG TPA: toll/interleukin-1 receptor domain-containing protein [Allosphingosinicella sp.]|nr:toll/interleukin-1 receptor domain-containing protein [Allosphingosinicella sp.]